MRIDPAAAATVAAILRSDIEVIRKLNGQLEEMEPDPGKPGTSFRDLAAAAYVLHNLCNAMENSFEHISRAFENHVKDRSQRQKELLMKMFLEIPDIRPAILPSAHRKLVNELRGFRHVFRHSYDFEIDQRRRFQLVAVWTEGKQDVIAARNRFQTLLLEADAP